MDTTTLHVSLPQALKTYVKKRVQERQYSNASDYVRALIRADQVRQEEDRLERMLIEGIGSGAATPMTKKKWAALRAEVQRGKGTRAHTV
jgi:antitoxin ParD1/3/4